MVSRYRFCLLALAKHRDGEGTSHRTVLASVRGRRLPKIRTKIRLKRARMERTQSMEPPIGSMANEDDRRSIGAAAELMRPQEGLDQLEDPEDGQVVDDSVTSTPRKRKRRDKRAKFDRQEVIESLPDGGSFSKGDILVEGLQENGSVNTGLDTMAQSDGDDGSPGLGGDQDTKTEPKRAIASQDGIVHGMPGKDEKMQTESEGDLQTSTETPQPISNPNPGADPAQHIGPSAKVKPRPPSKIRKDVRSNVPTHPEMRIGLYLVAYHITLGSRVADVCDLLGGQDVSTRLALSRLEGFVQRLSNLNPDQNQSEVRFARKEVHNAEVDYNYCLYYPVDKAWRPPPSADKRNNSKVKSLPKPKQWRSALWHLVEKSMKSGKLEQIRDGTLVVTEIPVGISEPVESVLHELKKPEDDGNEDLREIKMYQVQERSLESTSRSPEQMMINVSNGVSKERANQEDENNLEWRMKQEGKHPHADKMEPTAPHGDVDLGNGSEEGEVAEGTSHSEMGDAMLHYSNSDGFRRELPDLQQHDGPSDVKTSGHALKDLSSKALKRQLRYFHLGKPPEEVDLCLPVRCLACGKIGHDSENCETLRCSVCGAYNQHTTIRCPARLKCSKCREDGHGESSCPYKLKQISLDEITCDLCQLNGHVEDDCELMWRTSGQLWTSRFSALSQIRLSCYECGNQGHLGNDCPTRRPGKGLGSSSWSMAQNFDAPLRSEQQDTLVRSHPPRRPRRQPKGEKAAEVKIKGRALKRPSIQPQEVLAERNDFLHTKKVAAPARKGKIRINAGMGQRLNETPPPGPSISISRPFGGYGLTQQHQRPNYHHDNGQASGGEAGFARYNHGSPIYDGHYGGRRGRSRSPPQDSRNRDYRGDRYQPGRPPPSGGHRNENMYRPMPSAARNAYIRHRT